MCTRRTAPVTAKQRSTAGTDAAVDALTRARASIDVTDVLERTPLDDACVRGRGGVVVFLVLKGAFAQK